MSTLRELHKYTQCVFNTNTMNNKIKYIGYMKGKNIIMINGLPDKLKMLRWKYNLTQKKVADKLNVSPSIISSYEVGERTPSLDNILALARLYHCTTDYLLGNDSQPSKAVLDISHMTNEQIHALQFFIDTIPSAHTNE